MDNRGLALKHLSDAIDMDSNGYHQSAFAKYLQSLQVLTVYLNEMFSVSGFQNIMLQRKKEVLQVLSMIHECSDRVSAIIENDNNKTGNCENSSTKSFLATNASNSSIFKEFTHVSPVAEKFPAFEKLEKENVSLLKRYQWRFERAKDESARINLKLELQRQLIENGIIAKKKYDATLKKLQRERTQQMELEMKKLKENRLSVNADEKEKQQLYLSVLEYTKTETWPCTWKLFSQNMSTSDVAQKILQKTVRCSCHPLSQWLLLVQTNVKREIDTQLKQFTLYLKILPDASFILDKTAVSFVENEDNFTLSCSKFDTESLPQRILVSLQKFLERTSSAIIRIVENVSALFYLTYQSLLPKDSEEICHRMIEAYVLEPLWMKLLLLYRISNLPSEYKLLQTMAIHQNSNCEVFGSFQEDAISEQMCEECVSLLKDVTQSKSISEKLRIFVEVSQKICSNPCSSQGKKRLLGADDLIPLLCYVVVKSCLPQLTSECLAIEQLFDVKYMFGEEGYALSSFLTAVKYLEIRKLLDGDQHREDTPHS